MNLVYSEFKSGILKNFLTEEVVEILAWVMKSLGEYYLFQIEK